MRIGRYEPKFLWNKTRKKVGASLMTEKELHNVFAKLTLNTTFRTEQIDYSEKHFGNIFILLRARSNIEVRFIQDRSVFWCEIGKKRRAWFFADYLFEVIGIKERIENGGFIAMATSVLQIIESNEQKIASVFDMIHGIKVRWKIRAEARKRTIGTKSDETM